MILYQSNKKIMTEKNHPMNVLQDTDFTVNQILELQRFRAVFVEDYSYRTLYMPDSKNNIKAIIIMSFISVCKLTCYSVAIIRHRGSSI